MEYQSKKSKIRQKRDTAASKFKPSKWGETLLAAIIEDAIRRGAIDPIKAGHTDIMKYIDSTVIPKLLQKGQFLWAIDHRCTLLNEARSYFSYGAFELALLLYATWIEHFMNGIVESGARRKRVASREIPELIRNTSLSSKMSWLLHLLGLTPIASPKRHYIEQIMHSRNSFVHYKWKFENIDDDSHDTQLERLLEPIEGLVTYLKAYEKRQILPHSRRKLKKLLNKGIDALRQEGSPSSHLNRSEN